MCRHTHNVVHHSHGIFKHGLIDLLVDVTNENAALVVGGGVGFVDMADFAGFRVQDLAVDLEFLRNFLKVTFAI
jgi:hypothetical protein